MSASETRGGTTSDNLHLGLSGRVHFIYSSSGSEKGTEELPTGNLLGKNDDT